MRFTTLRVTHELFHSEYFDTEITINQCPKHGNQAQSTHHISEKQSLGVTVIEMLKSC